MSTGRTPAGHTSDLHHFFPVWLTAEEVVEIGRAIEEGFGVTTIEPTALVVLVRRRTDFVDVLLLVNDGAWAGSSADRYPPATALEAMNPGHGSSPPPRLRRKMGTVTDVVNEALSWPQSAGEEQ